MLPVPMMVGVVAHLQRSSRQAFALSSTYAHRVVELYLHRKLAFLRAVDVPVLRGLSLADQQRLLFQGTLHHRPHSNEKIIHYSRTDTVDIFFDEDLIPTVGNCELVPARHVYHLPDTCALLVLSLEYGTLLCMHGRYHQLPYSLIQLEYSRRHGYFGLSDDGRVLWLGWNNFQEPLTYNDLPIITSMSCYARRGFEDSLVLVSTDGALLSVDVQWFRASGKSIICKSPFADIPPAVQVKTTADSEILFVLLRDGTVLTYPDRTIHTHTCKITALVEYLAIRHIHNNNGCVMACYDVEGDCHLAYRTQGKRSLGGHLYWKNIGRIRDVIIDNTDPLLIRGIRF